MDTKITEIEKEELIEKFMEEYKLYNADWKQIVDANQFPDKFSDEEMQKYKVNKFCDAIKEFMKLKTSPSTLRKFGEIISYSHAQVDKIIKKKIKSVPWDRLESIADRFYTSPAYLIGLTDDRSYIPKKIDTYFWEKPNSEYKVIEGEIRKRLGNERAMHEMVTVQPDSLDMIKNDIINLIGKNYDLALYIRKLLSAKSREKQYNLIKILEYLTKL